MKAYALERVQLPLIKDAQEETLVGLERQIARIDKELDKLIKEDPHIHNRLDSL
jgi:hypothetical protein